MTYRILGFVFFSRLETFGGDLMPNAWIIPLGQDGLIGLTAPIVVFLIATRPRLSTYVIAIAWLWWGIADFGVGLVVEHFYPPFRSPMGPHVPDVVMTIWLLVNLGLELWAFALMLTPRVRGYFVASEGGVPLSLRESAMGGAWIWIILGSAAIGLLFSYVAAGMNFMFAMLGFPAT